jgi:hypothetical protein
VRPPFQRSSESMGFALQADAVFSIAGDDLRTSAAKKNTLYRSDSGRMVSKTTCSTEKSEEMLFSQAMKEEARK